MTDWINNLSRMFQAFGTTAFGVGFMGMSMKNMNNASFYNSIFGCGANNFYSNRNMFNMYDTNIYSNPYAFLNANQISAPTSVRRTSALPKIEMPEMLENPTVVSGGGLLAA